MPSLKAIRTRIASVKSTQKITRAMKLVAAARLRRAQDAIVGARPYANALAEVMAEVALRAGAEAHPLLERRTPERLTLITVTTDRGLAGGLNTNVFRAVQRFQSEHQDAKQIVFEVVGRKGRDYFRRRRMAVNHELAGPTGDTAVELARQVAHIAVKQFSDGRSDAVYLVFNEFKSALAQKVVIEPLLPVSPSSLSASSSGSSSSSPIDFVYEPSKRDLLNTLLPLFI